MVEQRYWQYGFQCCAAVCLQNATVVVGHQTSILIINMKLDNQQSCDQLGTVSLHQAIAIMLTMQHIKRMHLKFITV